MKLRPDDSSLLTREIILQPVVSFSNVFQTEELRFLTCLICLDLQGCFRRTGVPIAHLKFTIQRLLSQQPSLAGPFLGGGLG